MPNRVARAVFFILMCSLPVIGLGASVSACKVENPHAEGFDPSAIPEDVRSDYVLFTLRCSKCHALSRALQSGITDDAYWADYVERMRRQPGSGIAPEESPRIQRFLHYYSQGVLQHRNASVSQETMPRPLPDDGGGAL